MTTSSKGKSPRRRSGRASKYRNHRIKTVSGWFDSKGELRRWLFLLAEEKRGAVSDLKRQVHFPLIVNNYLVTTYVADFTYIDRNGRYTVEDFKGIITPEFNLKAKLFKAIHGYEIKIVKTPTEDA